MRKKVISAALSLLFVVSLSAQALAAEQSTPTVVELFPLARYEAATPNLTPTASSAGTTGLALPTVLLGGLLVSSTIQPTVIEGTTYCSIRGLVELVHPAATAVWATDRVLIETPGLTLTAKPGELWLIANGRYLYVRDGIRVAGTEIIAPIRVVAKALGLSVGWDAATGTVSLQQVGGPILSGDQFYSSDAVYWLSRIINAESGNQPIAGRVAVGTVILNRVKSPLYPDTIYDVIFDRKGGTYQFSPARSGSIHREPNTTSVISAKLCLDGAKEAGDSLYFNAVGLSSWAARNRDFVTTIAGHTFYE